jgi:hypothetical protein
LQDWPNRSFASRDRDFSFVQVPRVFSEFAVTP